AKASAAAGGTRWSGNGRFARVRAMTASRSRSKYWLNAFADPAVSVIAKRTRENFRGSRRSDPSTTSPATAVTITSATIRGFVSSMKSRTGELVARDDQGPEEDEGGAQMSGADGERNVEEDVQHAQGELHGEEYTREPKGPPSPRRQRAGRGPEEKPQDDQGHEVGPQAVRELDADQPLQLGQPLAVARREIGTRERGPGRGNPRAEPRLHEDGSSRDRGPPRETTVGARSDGWSRRQGRCRVGRGGALRGRVPGQERQAQENPKEQEREEQVRHDPVDGQFLEHDPRAHEDLERERHQGGDGQGPEPRSPARAPEDRDADPDG